MSKVLQVASLALAMMASGYCAQAAAETKIAVVSVPRIMQQIPQGKAIEAKLKSEFSSAAKNRDRNAAQLLRDFMRDFVRQQHEAAEHDAWFREQVQTGIDAANASFFQALCRKADFRDAGLEGAVLVQADMSVKPWHGLAIALMQRPQGSAWGWR